MIGCARSRKYSYIVTICALASLLAVVWAAAAAAQGAPPGPPGTGGPGPPGNPGDNVDPPTRTPTPTPTPPRGNGGPPTRTPTPTPSRGNGGPSRPPTQIPAPVDPTLTEHERRAALAPNRIVFHPATPVQLCKVDDGLQVYFIGADGKTFFGPWVPSFAELAATYPAGESASIFSGRNPLTGKPVDIDYLPAKQKLRVSTFYADRPPYDINKPYVYTVDPNHTIIHEQW